ncbi:MAG TPA: hypothetical protein VGL91_00320 [Acidobacteriota bacterium]|jgi:hypothetical protein
MSPVRLTHIVALIWIAGSHLTTAQTQELILPVAVNGVVRSPLHFQTTYRILNTSDAIISVTFEARRQDGSETNLFKDLFCDVGPIPPPILSKTIFTLQPNGAIELPSKSASDALFNGWIRLTYVSATPSAVQANSEVTFVSANPVPCPPNIAICQRPSGDILSSATVSAVKSQKEFHLPATITTNRHTAIAVVNPSPTQKATVTLTLLDSIGRVFLVNGAAISSKLEIPPGTKLSSFLWEAFVTCLPFQPCIPTQPLPPPAPEMFHGSLKITSDNPVGVAALNVLLPEGKLVNIPVVSIEP